jgi:hypothetical protein
MLSTRTASLGNWTTKIRNRFYQLYASTVPVILYGSHWHCTGTCYIGLTSNTDKWPELEKQNKYTTVTCISDSGRGLNWWMDLLTTYTRLGTTRSYNATASHHKSPQHPLGLFQPAVSSLAVPWQRLLTLESLHLRALTSFPAGHRLTNELGLALSLAYNLTARTK